MSVLAHGAGRLRGRMYGMIFRRGGSAFYIYHRFDLGNDSCNYPSL